MEAFQLENIKLGPDGRALIILDQSLLPNEETYITLNTPESCWEAIHSLRVRGAPAIGIFAGYAMYFADNDGWPDPHRRWWYRIPCRSSNRYPLSAGNPDLPQP